MILAFALAPATSVLLMMLMTASMATAFLPIIAVDIYIETQLADLKSKDDERTANVSFPFAAYSNDDAA